VVGKDTLTGLTHSAQTFPVTVRYASAALSITSGATSGNTGNVQFLLPGGVSLKNITCPFVSGPTLGSEIDPAAISMSCTINPTSLAASANLQTPSVAVTVLTGGGSSTAQIAGSTTLYAGLIGLPVFAIFGLLRGRKTRGAAIFRLFALAALAIAGLQLMGCGGSFTKPKVNGTPTPPGGYDLLIQGTGSDGNTYQSVLTVNVTL
jgi:subtilisin family serine protease